MFGRIKNKRLVLIVFVVLTGFAGCKTKNQNKKITMTLPEKQISFSEKNHALDNNDNFSPDDRFLCYDTRGTVFNDNIGNCKTIEKIEISTGTETVLYKPESITGEQAAPGVGAVSWHPSDNKVIFIHGPLVEEIEERGYYGMPNRTGVEVTADGKQTLTKVDMRDISADRPTIPGAHRGGTHRHEYTRNGKRIGFTYDDFLVQNIDRTIGYVEPNTAAPEEYSHFFAVLLKPVEKGKSKPGEIEKAYGDSWVGSAGTMRAFIGKVRAENGIDYDTSLFVADVPENIDITTASSGDAITYPKPPVGIKIRRLTFSRTVSGIVRGSVDGKRIAFLAKDDNGTDQVFLIDSMGSEHSPDPKKQPRQLSHFSSDATFVRWHPQNKWIFAVTGGNIAALYTGENKNFGKTIMLTNEPGDRTELVVSNNGKLLAYNRMVKTQNNQKWYKQIFTLNLDREMLEEQLK